MNKINQMKNEFKKNGGILKTIELNEMGFSSRQIGKLMQDGIITRIKYGFYELREYHPKEEVIIAKLFPKAVIFLESALLYYGYTDRIPLSWQIAVDKDSNKKQYEIDYPFIEPYYIENKYLNVGVSTIEIEGVPVKIYDRDRTMCDVLRYETKIEREVFAKAISNYVADKEKNIRNLLRYAEIFNIKNKVQTYIGVRL
ncbi:Transcriptional regulator, AbiEi antitoxin, Type IV TA system [Anaerosphaera aminiphila DSM 21120]|uniref:Transcriptional regulator, AbiEi antitoxin, Type IV TA system n=1 Tax=Anaerosphaera aminiphila DSM 21120 TaxID=1120995 RepID=A0A1M5PL73_9FIRM|nr:hypothetical protein [Anaerosphaera aminiphila]SHH02482.1 Transcriptional regulator, AbiEi antitoxin, Type IV TA system [Anaerosphaera aminiphila DSM 21120]